MIFSSLVFLLLFLPIVVFTYYLSPRPYRNAVLLFGSFFFYWWGTGELFYLIIVSIFVDYILGSVQSRSSSLRTKKLCVGMSVVTNLGLLCYFKYFSFLETNLHSLFPVGSQEPALPSTITLPIGISFYTFQTISYQIDLYRGVVKHERNLLNFSLFVALFPQLVAGPIVRYREIRQELSSRIETVSAFTYGLSRFVVGLAKKLLLADSFAVVSDYAFTRTPEFLPASSPRARVHRGGRQKRF